MSRMLEELCLLNGVSGDEGRVREYISKAAKLLCDKIWTDKMGNLIAFKKGKTDKKRLMICAHMDEVGLIIKNIDKQGFLYFDTVGGIDSRVLLSKKIFIGKKEVPGVIGIKAVHLTEKAERETAVTIDKLYIDIGAKTKAEAQKKVSLGDFASFQRGFSSFGDGLIRSKAIDDRAGCAIMLDIIKEDLPCDTYFAFTVQEEVGLRGAHVASFDINPDAAIIVETTTSAQFYGVDEKDYVSLVRGGAVISAMDRAAVYDRELVKKAIELADSNNIKWQPKGSTAGGNDSAAVQRARAGIRVVAFSIPCRYLHSPISVIALEDYQAVRDLTKLMALSLGGDNL